MPSSEKWRSLRLGSISISRQYGTSSHGTLGLLRWPLAIRPRRPSRERVFFDAWKRRWPGSAMAAVSRFGRFLSPPDRRTSAA
jgi:hypothetical protein